MEIIDVHVSNCVYVRVHIQLMFNFVFYFLVL